MISRSYFVSIFKYYIKRGIKPIRFSYNDYHGVKLNIFFLSMFVSFWKKSNIPNESLIGYDGRNRMYQYPKFDLVKFSHEHILYGKGLCFNVNFPEDPELFNLLFDYSDRNNSFQMNNEVVFINKFMSLILNRRPAITLGKIYDLK